jgi:hypothetical protein
MELVKWLYANHPFLSKKKRHEGKLLILELLLESISAFQFSKTHLVSNMGSFQVTLPSLAQHAYCISISSSELPVLVANLLMAWFSLLLVHFSTNSINSISMFVNFMISTKQTANCFTIISCKHVYC